MAGHICSCCLRTIMVAVIGCPDIEACPECDRTDAWPAPDVQRPDVSRG